MGNSPAMVMKHYYSLSIRRQRAHAGHSNQSRAATARLSQSGGIEVGANNLSTTFSSVITDGTNGTGGSLSKIGKGKLSLTKANTYTDGTTITKGTLLVKNKTGSATGTGAVQVNAGTLGGTGKISGAVTIGNGSTSGAILLPGTKTRPGTDSESGGDLLVVLAGDEEFEKRSRAWKGLRELARSRAGLLICAFM